MPENPTSFDELFALSQVGEDAFRATLSGFGGLTLGCATRAAALTCPDRNVHSLSMCFLRPVPGNAEVDLEVLRLADGRRFARRRVVGRLGGREVCDLTASFTSSDLGPTIGDERSIADLPEPETLLTDLEVARAEGWAGEGPGELEWRWIGRPWDSKPGEASLYRAWVRPRIDIAPLPGLFASSMAFLADYHSHWPAARRISGIFDSDHYTSLDQTVWIHREIDWDDFLLIESELEAAHSGRALSRRCVYTRNGERVATMCQEALIPVQKS